MNFIFQPGKVSHSGGRIDKNIEYKRSDLEYSLECLPSIENVPDSNKDLVIKWVFDLSHNGNKDHNHTVKYYYSILNEGAGYDIKDLNIIIDESFSRFKIDLGELFIEKNIYFEVKAITKIDRDAILLRLTESLLPLTELQDI